VTTIALTGGIGSGKSTVSARLAELGAVIIDADAIARDVVAVGTEGLKQVVARFGAGLLGADGALNRPELGKLVFADPAALADLNAIVHPLVRARVAELVSAAPPGSVLVHDTPLLIETAIPAGQFDEIVIVMAPEQVRLERLEQRGLPRDQALARMAQQATDKQRREAATVLLDNSGSRSSLLAQVDALWARLNG
jgi:dephospho-CoA kinase